MEAFAATHPGLESVLAAELAGIGVDGAAVDSGGAGFEADLDLVYRVNLLLRTASRVLVRVAVFHARSFAELERHARRVLWASYLAPGTVVHFRVTSKKSKLYHEDGIAERLASAVSERIKGVTFVAERSEVDANERDVAVVPAIQRFVVRLFRDQCIVSVDSSGPPLHRRGYRQDSAKAPIRETLAAGLLLAAGWSPRTPLVDPFCGSGTIPIEAALIATGAPPGRGRRFAFERWPGFDPDRWQSIRDTHRVTHEASQVIGSDRDRGAIEAARANAARAGVAEVIEWREAAVSRLMVPAHRGWVVTNPPYGARMGAGADLRDLYARFGQVLRRVCPGWHVGMVGTDQRLTGQVGLDWRELARTENGGIPVRFLTAAIPG